MASPVPVQKTHSFCGLFRGKPRGFHLCCLRRSEMKTSFHFTHYPRQIRQAPGKIPGALRSDKFLNNLVDDGDIVLLAIRQMCDEYLMLVTRLLAKNNPAPHIYYAAYPCKCSSQPVLKREIEYEYHRGSERAQKTPPSESENQRGDK